jgi:hypothetical protein
LVFIDPSLFDYIVAAPLPLVLTQSQAEYSLAGLSAPAAAPAQVGLCMDTYRSISHKICAGPMRPLRTQILGVRPPRSPCASRNAASQRKQTRNKKQETRNKKQETRNNKQTNKQTTNNVSNSLGGIEQAMIV